ncbi:hypothetical protein [Lacticaseibacillus porcinae]|uniref:hypothetical protein n=1 Tax=Lacticaseibacillus porcinae TaxID=1123687 RepID=UPI000F7701A5|nr:hypothetical protein [Lacticaseibacillus porcinae]
MSQPRPDSRKLKMSRLAGLGIEYGAIDIPIIGGVITAATLIAMPIYGIYAHRAAKRELKVLWQRADALELDGADLKRLSGSTDYGSLDWAMSRKGGIYPSLALIRKVNDQLAKLIE